MNIVVLFGGKAPEHEVSIITGIQVMNALIGAGHEVIPVYVTKEGEWVVGDKEYFNPKTFSNQEKAVQKKPRVMLTPKGKLVEIPEKFSFMRTNQEFEVDVYFPTFHGKFGEDGCVQGLLELADATYTGCNVQASAIGMDKVLSKKVAKSVGIPALADNWGTKKDWEENIEKFVAKIMEGLKYPVFVKPVRLGSSIGVTRANNRKELIEALEVAFCYDTKVIVEQGINSPMEVNISLLGNGPYEASVTESPRGGEILSFEDKYLSGSGKASGMASAKRVIPAPVNKNIEKKIIEYSKLFFNEIDGSGLCRIDWLVKGDRIYFNEINTLPGSIAFYLWEKKKKPIHKLVDEMVKLAISRKKEKEDLITTFESNILEGFEKGNKLKG